MCKTVAIIVIGIIEIIALLNGINGVAISLSIGAIAGIGGFEIGNIYQTHKKR